MINISKPQLCKKVGDKEIDSKIMIISISKISIKSNNPFGDQCNFLLISLTHASNPLTPPFIFTQAKWNHIPCTVQSQQGTARDQWLENEEELAQEKRKWWKAGRAGETVGCVAEVFLQHQLSNTDRGSFSFLHSEPEYKEGFSRIQLGFFHRKRLNMKVDSSKEKSDKNTFDKRIMLL